MRKPLFYIAALLCLSLAGEASADDVRFRLVNGTEFPIRALVLSQANLAAWGPNVLGPPSIKPGEAREVTVRGAFFACNLDLKVAFDTNTSEPVWQYLNVCELRKIRLRFDAQSGVTTASYEE